MTAKDEGSKNNRCADTTLRIQGYAQVHDQFMLGEDILVAPVTVKGATGRSVMLPPGLWAGEGGAAGCNGDTGTVRGPAELRVDAGEGMPVTEQQLVWFRRVVAEALPV